MKKQFHLFQSKLLILAIFLSISLSSFAQWRTIKNGILWKDTQGKSVQAHGGNFLKVGSSWYMVGEDRSASNQGVNMYSTTDFISWKFEGKIIPPSAYASDRFIERPKLMRCPSTGKFVVWCHYEGSNYGPAEAASFVSDKINGPYTLKFHGRPFNIVSRDCNVFVDTNGKGYFISTTDNNQNLTLFELSTDYLTLVKSTRLTAFNGLQREAPAIVRIGNTYFLISSKCTGWAPNQATVSYSTSLTGGWSSQVNIGNKITYDTQAASILTVQGSKGTTYIYVGDRWQDPNLADSKTIMFPISFSGNTVNFKYTHQWDMDFVTGLWRTTTRTDLVPKTGWKIKYASSAEAGNEAAKAIDGNVSTIWHSKWSGTAPTHPHEIQVDMGKAYTVKGFIYTPRTDVDVNGAIRDCELYVSSDGNTWKQVAKCWFSWTSEVSFTSVSARYFRIITRSDINGTQFASAAELDMVLTSGAAKVKASGESEVTIENKTQTNCITMTNNSLKLDYLLSKNGNVTIAVYDISGKNLLYKNLGNFNAGAFQYELPFENIKKGVCIVKVNFAGETKSSKIVVL